MLKRFKEFSSHSFRVLICVIIVILIDSRLSLVEDFSFGPKLYGVMLVFFGAMWFLTICIQKQRLRKDKEEAIENLRDLNSSSLADRIRYQTENTLSSKCHEGWEEGLTQEDVYEYSNNIFTIVYGVYCYVNYYEGQTHVFLMTEKVLGVNLVGHFFESLSVEGLAEKICKIIKEKLSIDDEEDLFDWDI